MTTTPALREPSDPFGQPFVEKGYHVVAFMPRSPAERTEFRVVVQRAGQVLFTVTVPMVYEPVFGVDAGDRAALEDATDQILTALPQAADFTPDVLDGFRTPGPGALFRVTLVPGG